MPSLPAGDFLWVANTTAGLAIQSLPVTQAVTELGASSRIVTILCTDTPILEGPKWQPSGHQILFASSLGSGPLPPETGGVTNSIGLFVLNVGDVVPDRVPLDGGYVSGASWCGDSGLIAATTLTDPLSIHLAAPAGEARSYVHEGERTFAAVCSPPANEIAFLARDPDTGTDHLYVSDLNFTNPIELAANVGGSPQLQLAWSPDARLIAYSMETGGQNQGLCIADTAGTSLDPSQASLPCPIPQTVGAVWPSWSPDGRYIAYALQFRYRAFEIYILDLAPSPSAHASTVPIPTLLAQSSRWIGPYFASPPVWVAPDALAFVLSGSHGSSLQFASVSAECSREIAQLPSGAGELDWRPVP